MQVLAKSCKMIPVMLMGTLVSGKRYSSIEYFCALVLAAGISLFASKSSSKVGHALQGSTCPDVSSGRVRSGCHAPAATGYAQGGQSRSAPAWQHCVQA